MPTRRDELDHVGEYNVMPGQEGSAPTVDSDAESAGDDVSYIDLVNEVLEAKAVGDEINQPEDGDREAHSVEALKLEHEGFERTEQFTGTDDQGSEKFQGQEQESTTAFDPGPPLRRRNCIRPHWFRA